MLTIKGFSGAVIVAALAFPVAGYCRDHAVTSALYSAPMLAGGGVVDCVIANVGRDPRNVTTTYFDGAGHTVGSSGAQLIAAGVVGGASFGSQDGYCQWLVEGSTSDYRAAGRVNHYSGGADVYPATGDSK